jgi:hypothetical protein
VAVEEQRENERERREKLEKKGIRQSHEKRSQRPKTPILSVEIRESVCVCGWVALTSTKNAEWNADDSNGDQSGREMEEQAVFALLSLFLFLHYLRFLRRRLNGRVCLAH